MQSRRAQAFDLDHEPVSMRDEYGRHRFGQSCLLTRRLVEAGVNFVEVFHRGVGQKRLETRRILEEDDRKKLNGAESPSP